ncbi:MAG: hypothetical protein Q7T41_04570, partial [Candidatus Saccharibacteria bacterium]|nr:hypothetical protein [Candidatus Saccharibacteria bacterium]
MADITPAQFAQQETARDLNSYKQKCYNELKNAFSGAYINTGDGTKSYESFINLSINSFSGLTSQSAIRQKTLQIANSFNNATIRKKTGSNAYEVTNSKDINVSTLGGVLDAHSRYLSSTEKNMDPVDFMDGSTVKAGTYSINYKYDNAI